MLLIILTEYQRYSRKTRRGWTRELKTWPKQIVALERLLAKVYLLIILMIFPICDVSICIDYHH